MYNMYTKNMRRILVAITTLIHQSENHVTLGARDIAHELRSTCSADYHPTLPCGPPIVNCGRGAGSRALARTDRLIANMKTWHVLPSSAELGSSVLRDNKSGVFFPEVTWRGDDGSAVRHWLRIRPPLHRQETPPASIRFVTGSCLFGRSGATMNLADGSRRPLVSNRLSLSSPIKGISIRDGFSLYELDTAYRLSSVIGSMAQQCSHATRIYVHIPRPEYILVMFGHRRGVRGESVMMDWMEAVEQRGARVGELFKTLLATWSTSRVDVGSPLDAILMPYLRDAVAQGKTPSPHELMEVIHASDTAVSGLLSEWLAARKDSRNVDYYDLAHFGYVAGVAVNLVDRSLTVEVDNPFEEPIFRALSRVIRRAGEHLRVWPGNVMAMYPYGAAASPQRESTEWETIRRHP
jgi:hypothetical protein